LIGRTVSEELPEAVPATEQEPILIAASSGAIPATEQEPVLALDLTDTNHNKSNNKNKTSKK